MRRLVVCNTMSLDGYVEGPGGNVMALPMGVFFDEYNLDRQRATDTLLLGATTYLGLTGYWSAGGREPAPGWVGHLLVHCDVSSPEA